jgi:hypothetical protein
MGTRKRQSLIVGWVNTNIRAVIEAGLLSQFSSALITSIANWAWATELG